MAIPKKYPGNTLDAPKSLPTKAKALWHLTQHQLVQQGTWQDSDAPLLERYVRVVVGAQEARATADKDPFVPGSKGQLIAHPGFKLARDNERDAEAYAKSLLLTPEMRLKHQLGVSEDQDDLDRVLNGG